MKTRIISTAILVLFIMTMTTSCEKVKGKGEVITETRTTGTYNAVSLAISANVYITQGAVYELRLNGQENILDEIVTEVEGDRLVIRVRKGVILGNHEPVRVYITAPAVTHLDVSGSGDLFFDNEWTAVALSTNISGSGNINLALVNTAHFSAKISGSGTIRATSGKATREELTISGSGTIDLRSVEADTVYSTISGSGDTYVYARNYLDVTISGSGNVWYFGTPSVNIHISGSGNLKKM
jgi:hypothetical protein